MDLITGQTIDPEFFQKIDGWFDFDNIYDLAVAEVKEPGVFVEIGAWLGRSTAYMASRIALTKKDVRFFAVDGWIGFDGDKPIESLFSKFLINMLLAGVADFVSPLRLLSIEAVNLFPAESVDFCYLDGDHSYNGVRTDLALWFPKVKPGGLFAGHDYGLDSVKRAVDEFFGRPVQADRSSWIVRKLPAAQAT